MCYDFFIKLLYDHEHSPSLSWFPLLFNKYMVQNNPQFLLCSCNEVCSIVGAGRRSTWAKQTLLSFVNIFAKHKAYSVVFKNNTWIFLILNSMSSFTLPVPYSESAMPAITRTTVKSNEPPGIHLSNSFHVPTLLLAGSKVIRGHKRGFWTRGHIIYCGGSGVDGSGSPSSSSLLSFSSPSYFISNRLSFLYDLLEDSVVHAPF